MCREMQEYRKNVLLYSKPDERIVELNKYIDENIKFVFKKTKVILERNKFLNDYSKIGNKQNLAS